MKYLITIVLLGFLAACQPSTEVQPTTARAGNSASLQGQVDNFLINTALAQVYTERCRSYGVRLKNPNQNATINSFILGLMGQGYSEAQIKSAVAKARKKNLGQVAVQRIIQRGVQPGNIPSLCNAARSEISDRTGVGQLMKRA